MIVKQEKPSFAVIGSGSWGTAIAKILTDNGFVIRWWGRSKKRVKAIKESGANPDYLSGVKLLKSKIKPTHKINKVLSDCSHIVLAVPSAFLKQALEKADPELLRKKHFISGIKGIIPELGLTIIDFLEQEYQIPKKQISIVSGPTHAEEIALRRQSYLTIANRDIDIAKKIAESFNNEYINTSTLEDIEGIEYSAIMKNIISIAGGIAHGLKNGDNFHAVLVSNAMQEISLFLQTVIPMKRDLNRAVYLGDVLVTAYSQFSRNRTFGGMIGKGYSVQSALVEMTMVAEGYYASKNIYLKAKEHKLDLPICFSVYRILYEGSDPYNEFKKLKEVLV